MRYNSIIRQNCVNQYLAGKCVTHCVEACNRSSLTCRARAITDGHENQPWVCPCGRAVGDGSPIEAATRTGYSLWAHLLENVRVEFHLG